LSSWVVFASAVLSEPTGSKILCKLTVLESYRA
jgi:hypothetical protein